MCAMGFKQELEYWEIDPNLIGQCCWDKYKSFLLPENSRSHPDHTESLTQDGCKETAWKILELNDPRRITKVTDCLLIILDSVFF